MRYSQRSLERLIIAISQLEDERELKTVVPLSEVLRAHVVDQIPASLHYKSGPDHRELPSEPTPAIINAMDAAFHKDNHVHLFPHDPAHKEWTEVYHAILEAAS